MKPDLVTKLRGMSNAWPYQEAADEIEALRHHLADERLCHEETRERLATAEKERDDIHDDYQSIGRELHAK